MCTLSFKLNLKDYFGIIEYRYIVLMQEENQGLKKKRVDSVGR